ncbi:MULTISPECIES: IclR family transcriptional regulator C-terminal domain-containing protein [unclassified Herbaspirillum]|uniref:IclR family transcriptional regulator domain-containing protein n=1 Tax=unclassified Herbaspirillum TaxID=2624150 RepID=UPI000E2E52C5|nr:MULTISPECIES: IclR family transcriptional regulator C-terminal domain-containing protein [unclassified Herbaspirillum]RFB71259.1 IclR family transcriptional regulator [Herbaspirillum sp. 3R-3a1]TFI08205.1 IclR family transcriptional regulator [Herbaspirillum sp. 3R11]TFI14620.1 IclR family transcriptional regulator [Herbaspirillum sp. 3R-11]TFI24971.1 IclR family transcriptional regulator [Herbaspirillum sp. 3C11]
MAPIAPDLSRHTEDAGQDGGLGQPLKRDIVAGLEKGLQVIEAFDQERTRLTIAEVAQLTGLTRAAARRYLITLTHLGYMRHDHKTFSLTPTVLRLGQSYLHSARLPRIVQPLLYRLAYSLGEAASCGVLDHDQLVCVAAVSAGQLVSTTLQPGTRVPAYCTANGRILLANLPHQRMVQILEKLELEQITSHTMTDKAQLEQEIVRVREQGYALVDQELELGLRTMAVPLRNFRGEVVAAMNISVHAARMKLEDMVERCLPALLKIQVEAGALL